MTLDEIISGYGTWYIENHPNNLPKLPLGNSNSFGYKCNQNRIICGDGATVSIQGSRFHYCSPRTDNPPNGYTEIEAGFPSVIPPASWVEYAEDKNDLLNTVYAYLPIECVYEFIALHGGEVLSPRSVLNSGAE